MVTRASLPAAAVLEGVCRALALGAVATAGVVSGCLAPLDTVPGAGFGGFETTDAPDASAAPTAPAKPARGVGVGGALKALLVLLALRSGLLADEELASGVKWVCDCCVGETIAGADGSAAALFDAVAPDVLEGRPDLRA